MRISIVVAASENDVIGVNGTLPWHLPDDLRHFKALTVGRPILMGRKTYASIGRALPERLNLVLTRDPKFAPAGVRVVHGLDEAIVAAEPAEELVVVGGEAVFELALPKVTRIHLTRVHTRIDGGVRFPSLSPAEWREVERTRHEADGKHAYAMTFLTLERTADSRA